MDHKKIKEYCAKTLNYSAYVAERVKYNISYHDDKTIEIIQEKRRKKLERIERNNIHNQ